MWSYRFFLYDDLHICVREGIQVNTKSSFLDSKQIHMAEALKGNTKHKALSSKQIESTHYQKGDGGEGSRLHG